MILPYYKIEKTEEGKQFFYSHEGYFNFWDEYLIMNNKVGAKIFFVLVNRHYTKFSNPPVDEDFRRDANSKLADSIYLKKPEEIFEDFPELDKYEHMRKYSKYYVKDIMLRLNGG